MNEPLPPELVSALNGETKDFAIKAPREFPRSTGIAALGFGLFWTGFTSIFWIVFFGPLFQGKEVHFTVNDVPTTASIDNMGSLLIPGLVIGVLTLVGLIIIVSGIRALMLPGPWFVGTATRLIIWSPKKFQTLNWEQFTGSIEITGKNPEQDITLEMRTGKMVGRKNAGNQYVPDRIYIASIPNAMIISEYCRKRIKENDPTPAN